MKICNYYNNFQTACTLMIDDLSEVAITRGGKLHPWNDWGYGLDSVHSLYKYFQKYLLDKYPEIKGTIFFVTKTHLFPNEKAGYKILKRDTDNKLKYFIKKIASQFELAFHGTTHGKYIEKTNPAVKGNWLQEFEYLTFRDIPYLKDEINKIEELLNIKFSGGKYPGYKKNIFSEQIIENLDFKWWASSAEMIYTKLPDSKHSYFGSKKQILDFPTNINGGLFKRSLKQEIYNRQYFSILKETFRSFKKEHYLQYLYENKYIMSIQEHFLNQRTDGKRQRPNVYDDISSLCAIFEILRGADIWHATCSDIAHYLDSFDHSDLKQLSNGSYKLSYQGNWDKMFLSVYSKSRTIKNVNTGEIICGFYKQGYWIFNDIKEGEYLIL